MPHIIDIGVIWKDFFEILNYLPITLELAVVSLLIGLVIGFLLAVIRIKKVFLLKPITTFFISIIRGTPIIIQLYATYFGIPILFKYINYYYGTNIVMVNMPGIVFAIVALALNQAAYNAVVIEAALQAVNKGEIEAAASIGMTGTQRMFRIIIPEAIELAIPSLGNNLINLVKGTSLAFSCAVIEMTAQGKILGGRTYRYFEAYIALGVIYWLITIVLEQAIQIVLTVIQVPDVPGKKRQFSLRSKDHDSNSKYKKVFSVKHSA